MSNKSDSRNDKPNRTKPTNKDLEIKHLNTLAERLKHDKNVQSPNYRQSNVLEFVDFFKKMLVDKGIDEKTVKIVDETLNEAYKKYIEKNEKSDIENAVIDYSDIVEFINNTSLDDIEIDEYTHSIVNSLLKSIRKAIFEVLPHYGINNRNRLLNYISRFMATRIDSNDDVRVGMKYFLFLYDIIKEKTNNTNKENDEAILLAIYYLIHHEREKDSNLESLLTFPFTVPKDMNLPITIKERRDIDMILTGNDCSILNPWNIETKFTIKKSNEFVVIKKKVRNIFDENLEYKEFSLVLYLPFHTLDSLEQSLNDRLKIVFATDSNKKFCRYLYNEMVAIKSTSILAEDDIDDMIAELIINAFSSVADALTDPNQVYHAVFQKIPHQQIPTASRDIQINNLTDYTRSPSNILVLISAKDIDKLKEIITEDKPQSEKIDEIKKLVDKIHIKLTGKYNPMISYINDFRTKIGFSRKKISLEFLFDTMKSLGIIPRSYNYQTNRMYTTIDINYMKTATEKMVQERDVADHFKSKMDQIKNAIDRLVEIAIVNALDCL